MQYAGPADSLIRLISMLSLHSFLFITHSISLAMHSNLPRLLQPTYSMQPNLFQSPSPTLNSSTPLLHSSHLLHTSPIISSSHLLSSLLTLWETVTKASCTGERSAAQCLQSSTVVGVPRNFLGIILFSSIGSFVRVRPI